MRCNVKHLITIVMMVVGIASNAAQADPITILRPFNMLDNISDNSAGLNAGVFEQFGAESVCPNGVGLCSPPAGTPPSSPVTTGVATRGNKTKDLDFIPHDVAPNFFTGAVTFDPTKTGRWDLTFTNGTDTAIATTPNINGVQLVPFANSVSISGNSAAPTFNWTVPSSFTPDGIAIAIRDTTEFIGQGGVGGGGVANIIYFQVFPGSTTSFTVNPLQETQPLQQGRNYALEIDLVDTRDNTASQSFANFFSRSQSFFDFTLLPTGAPPDVFLPTLILGATPYYQFHIGNVVAGQTLFIDPLVATGYTYMIGAGDPNFASVLLPTGIGDNLFDLFLWNGTDFVDSTIDLNGGVEYFFGGLGVDRFQIRGIETSAGLDPNDTTAFITGLTFAGGGEFSGIMTPLTQDVPEPTILSLLALGLAGLGFNRRKNDPDPALAGMRFAA